MPAGGKQPSEPRARVGVAAGDPGAPYGTLPRRARLPLVLLGVAYALWFLFLLWLAIDRR